jgi:hypothetical protein
VHLDVENELLEAMSDTVSNRARPQGEYSSTVPGTEEEVLHLNYVQQREKYPVTNMWEKATFCVSAFLWKFIRPSRKCYKYFPLRYLDCLNLGNMAPM